MIADLINVPQNIRNVVFDAVRFVELAFVNVNLVSAGLAKRAFCQNEL